MTNEQRVQQYCTITKDLLAARKDNGGDLSDAAEELFTDQLDDLWYKMTFDDRLKAQTVVAELVKIGQP